MEIYKIRFEYTYKVANIDRVFVSGYVQEFKHKKIALREYNYIKENPNEFMTCGIKESRTPKSVELVTICTEEFNIWEG